MEKKTPSGIRLIIAVHGFLGVLLTTVGYVIAMATDVRGAPDHAWFYGFLCLALGLAMLASAYGLWTLLPWAPSLAIWMTLAMVPMSALASLGIFLGSRAAASHLAASCLGLGLSLYMLHYLRGPALRHGYQGPAGSSLPVGVKRGLRNFRVWVLLAWSCWRLA